MAFPSYANAARQLDVRDRRFVAGIVAGKSIARAYVDAGYPGNVTDVPGRAWKKLQTRRVYAYWQAVLATIGLDDATLLEETRAFVATALSPETDTDTRIRAATLLLQVAGLALREQDIVGPKKPGRKPKNPQPD